MIPNKQQAGLVFDASIEAGGVTAPRLLLRGAGKVDLTGQVVGGSARFYASASTTASWSAGRYAWQLVGEANGELQEVARGQLEIEASFEALAAGFDPRTQAEIALDNINAVLANRATIDQRRYRIKDRELERMTISELLALKRHFAAEVAREQGRYRATGQTVRVSLS